MDKQLLRRVLDVKYRELAGLRSQRITISSFSTIVADVLAAAEPHVPECGRLQLCPTNMRVQLAKYKTLDLKFSASTLNLAREDRIDRRTLASLGFVPARQDALEPEPAEAEHEDDDPTCMAELVEQVEASREWMLVFLDVWPLRDCMANYMEEIRRVRATDPTVQDPTDAALQALLLQVDDLFPCQFQIRDACITNSDFVWFHKHFYL